MFCTPDKRTSNYGLVPPHDIFGGNDQLELEFPDEREQETFHPTVKIVRDLVKERYERGEEEWTNSMSVN